jgi:hypothetical protein
MMITLTFPERYAQARLYAAQMRTRKGMGDRYAHFIKPETTKTSRRLVSAKLENESSVA